VIIQECRRVLAETRDVRRSREGNKGRKWCQNGTARFTQATVLSHRPAIARCILPELSWSKSRERHFMCLRRYGVRRVIVLTMAVLAGLPALVGLPALAQQANNAEKPLAPMVSRTLHDMGKDAQMPPTLSNLLGLTPRREAVAVKQVAAKIRGTDMIGFNVSAKNHEDIVIFRETPTVRTYFLTSPEGVLRKVIEVRKPASGEGEFVTSELRPSTMTKLFDKEKQCWMDVAKNKELSSVCYFPEK
jgi:hypothetical protein